MIHPCSELRMMMYPRESNPSKVSQSKLRSAPCVASGRCLPWVASLAGQGLLSPDCSHHIRRVGPGARGGHISKHVPHIPVPCNKTRRCVCGKSERVFQEIGYEIWKLFDDNFEDPQRSVRLNCYRLCLFLWSK